MARSPRRRTLARAVSSIPGLLLLLGAGGGSWTSEVHWLLSDPLGSGVALFDAEGELVRHTRFRPFGGLDAEVSRADDRHLFAGHPRQAETGLVQMRSRWLDPLSGGFLSVDPFLVPGGPDFERGAHARIAARSRVEGAVQDDPRPAPAWPGADPFAPEPHPQRELTPAHLNAYAYAYQNPLGAVDPDGEFGVYIGVNTRLGAGAGISKTIGIGIDHTGAIGVFHGSGIGGHGGVTAGASLSLGALAPSATLASLGGEGLESGGSIGEGPAVGADVITGGGEVVAAEVNAGLSAGTPVEAHGTVTQTQVHTVAHLRELAADALESLADWLGGAQ